MMLLEAYKSLHEALIHGGIANHYKVKIKWIDVPFSEGEKRTLAAILSNNPPSLVNLNPDFSSILAQKGALEEISKMCGVTLNAYVRWEHGCTKPAPNNQSKLEEILK